MKKIACPHKHNAKLQVTLLRLVYTIFNQLSTPLEKKKRGGCIQFGGENKGAQNPRSCFGLCAPSQPPHQMPASAAVFSVTGPLCQSTCAPQNRRAGVSSD